MIMPIGEKEAKTTTAASHQRPIHAGEQEVEGRVCISLLGEIRVWLEVPGAQVVVPIRSYRRLELLAYIATVAPCWEQRVTSGQILTDVFEHIAPRSDVDNLRGLFQKHTQLLRKEINEVAQEMHIARIRLFQFEKVDNSSTKWWLSDECSVIDLNAVKLVHRQIEMLKEEGNQHSEALKAACEQLIRLYQSYRGDYLEKHLVQYDFGDSEWVWEPFTEYRDMYLQAMWDAAVAEHSSLLAQLSDQERYRCAKKAAFLYRTYALHAPKNRGMNIHAKKNLRQSERALRGYLRVCCWLMDAQTAEDGYAQYERMVRREFPEWRPNQKTIELLQTVRQQSGHNRYDITPLELLAREREAVSEASSNDER